MLSQAIAEEHHLHVGQAFALPTPDPTHAARRGALHEHRLGARRDHHERRPSTRAPGAAPTRAPTTCCSRPASRPAQGRARGRNRRSGRAPGLTVETAEQHANQQRALSRQGLERLTQIATLILIAAVLAMAAAMGNMVWQRRPRLAKLKLEGFPRGELWRTILLESFLLLGVGCPSGAVFGLYGQQLLDRALANVDQLPRRLLLRCARSRSAVSRSSPPPPSRSSRSPGTSPPACPPRSPCRTEYARMECDQSPLTSIAGRRPADHSFKDRFRNRPISGKPTNRVIPREFVA